MDDLFQREFHINAVAKAIGAKPVTLRSWFAKGKITSTVQSDDAPLVLTGGGRSGKTRGLGFRTAVEIAVAKAILDFPMGTGDLDAAFAAARVFAHTGEAQDARGPGRVRIPGLPFAPGVRTLMFLNGEAARIMPWYPENDELAAALHNFANPETMLVVNVDPIFARVVAGLGLDFHEIMLTAYGEPTTWARQNGRAAHAKEPAP